MFAKQARTSKRMDFKLAIAKFLRLFADLPHVCRRTTATSNNR